MPLYDYDCPSCKHATEVLASARPILVLCERCGEEATPAVSRGVGTRGVARTSSHRVEGESAGWKVTDRGSFVVKEKGDMVPTPAYKQGTCLTCMNKSPCVFLDANGAPEPCANCAGTSWRLEDVESVQSEVAYPHYNRGLGCTVKSPAHLRQLMRERGLVDADPRDVSDATERAHRHALEEEAEQERETRDQNERPEIKRALESPQYKDLLKRAFSSTLRPLGANNASRR